jgi:hypothetical protein
MVPVAIQRPQPDRAQGHHRATAGGIALVVFVFAAALMLKRASTARLAAAARRNVAVVFRNGSDSELSSGSTTIWSTCSSASQRCPEARAKGACHRARRDRRGRGGRHRRDRVDGIWRDLQRHSSAACRRAARVSHGGQDRQRPRAAPGTNEVGVGKVASTGRFKGISPTRASICAATDRCRWSACSRRTARVRGRGLGRPDVIRTSLGPRAPGSHRCGCARPATASSRRSRARSRRTSSSGVKVTRESPTTFRSSPSRRRVPHGAGHRGRGPVFARRHDRRRDHDERGGGQPLQARSARCARWASPGSRS